MVSCWWNFPVSVKFQPKPARTEEKINPSHCELNTLIPAMSILLWLLSTKLPLQYLFVWCRHLSTRNWAGITKFQSLLTWAWWPRSTRLCVMCSPLNSLVPKVCVGFCSSNPRPNLYYIWPLVWKAPAFGCLSFATSSDKIWEFFCLITLHSETPNRIFLSFA